MAFFRILLVIIYIIKINQADTNCQFNVKNPKGDNEVYDFSSLSANTPWEVAVNSDFKSKNGVLFVAICKRLEGLSNLQCPDISASSCLARQENSTWRSMISNAGSGNKLPNVKYDGRQLILTMEGEQQCKDGKNYSTTIFFHCNRETIGEPYFMGLSRECEIRLGWVSSTACRVTPDHDTCLLSVPSSRPLDLTSLSSPTFYTVRDPSGRLFELNFCQQIREGSCKQSGTACLVNTTTIIGTSESRGEISRIPGGVKLVYYSEGSSTTEINFLCNLTAPLKPVPQYISQRNSTFSFRVDTPYACPAFAIDCVAYNNEGIKYDLNSLRRTIWTVRDPRKKKTNLLYQLNVCGPLPQGLPSPCLAGNVGACVTNSKPNSTSYSLGLVENPPKITKEGNLLLEYRGGSPCKQSKFRARVSIALECSQRDQGPVLEAVHEECSYAFLWKTPAACPARPAKGENCKVEDLNLGYTFDVGGLYNNHADYQLQGEGDDSFRVNLCGSLHTPCAGQGNVSVCLKRAGKELAIGHRDDNLLYQDGRLSFKLWGDQCLPGLNSSVTIILSCEHLDPGYTPPTPQVFPSGQNDCRFYMVWNHPKACPPYNEVPCSVQDDDGQIYDLSDLSSRTANREARTRNGRRSGLQLNVCRSVVFGRDSPCEPSAGACLHSGDKFVNIGNVHEAPFIEGGQLKLKYIDGAVCNIPDGPSHMSTTITFVCEPDAQDTEPLYLSEEMCEHQIMWLTASACPQIIDEISNNSCSVVNPSSKHRFDLSSLKNKEFAAVDESGNIFNLAVCSSIKTPGCGQGTGSCQVSPGAVQNSGMANSNLEFRSGGSLVLQYTNGGPCEGGGQKQTHIEFLCGVEGSLEGPQIVDVLGGCVYVIHWHTELACEKRIHCVINYLDQEVDLSPLIRVTQNYRTTAPDGRDFFLNVCRPVISVPGLNCPAGSSACVARRKNNTYQDEMSLGFPQIRPMVISSQETSLMYIHGSPCPGAPGINISSLIRFKCDPAVGQGNPVFVTETHDCQYQFDWATSLVCGEREEKTGKCSVHSEQLKRDISLETLQKPGGYVTKSKGNLRYSLNLCGDTDVCRGAAVCQNSSSGWASHGTLQRALYDYQSDYLKLQYSGGSICTSKNDTYGAEIWLRCDATAGTGGPRVITEHVCFVIFEWRTSAVCASNKQRSTTPRGTLVPTPVTTPSSPPANPSTAKVQEAAGGSSAGTIVAAVVGVSVSLAVIILVALYIRRGHVCLPNWRLSRWLHSPSHSQVHYSRETLSSAFD